MSFRTTFAKSLVVMLVFVSSVHKIVYNSTAASELSSSYLKLFTALKGASINVPLEPALVVQYSSLIIYMAAVLGIVGSILVLAERKFGSCILITWLLMSLVVHGPFTADKEAVEVQTVVFLMHWGLIAGLVLTCPQTARKFK